MLDLLTVNSVSIKKVIDGQAWRKAYVNSARGRAELLADFPELVNEVFAVWGDTATVIEPVIEVQVPTEPQPTALEVMVAEQQEVIDDLVTLLVDKGVIW